MKVNELIDWAKTKGLKTIEGSYNVNDGIEAFTYKRIETYERIQAVCESTDGTIYKIIIYS